MEKQMIIIIQIKKEIFCKKDNIIIYQKNEDINKGIICPICRILIYQCKYCKRILNKATKNCCFRAHINSKLEGNKKYRYLNFKNDFERESFFKYIYHCFIPIGISFYILLISILSFFLLLENKNGETNDYYYTNKKRNIL